MVVVRGSELLVFYKNTNRQALWEEVQAGDELAEEVLSLIFHPCLTNIEVRCLDRDDWGADRVGSLNAALILKVKKIF